MCYVQKKSPILYFFGGEAEGGVLLFGMMSTVIPLNGV